MQLQLGAELEPAMERWLEQLMPGFAAKVEGASATEIAEIEDLAGRPLPRFYRWFLWRMGRKMGPFAYRTVDFSVGRILSCYADGTFQRDPRHLVIGFEADELAQTHIAYDFDYVVRDDARSIMWDGADATQSDGFETFREMLAWGLMLELRVWRQPLRVRAVLRDDETENVAMRVAPVMRKLGFISPIETGPYTMVYERDGAALVGTEMLQAALPNHQTICLGATSEGEARNLLGILVAETGVSLSVRDWEPSLP